MANCIDVTQNIRKELVNSFFEYFSSSTQNNWFLAIGNPIPWSFDRDIANSERMYFKEVSGSDDVVPLNLDSEKEKYDFYRTCTAMKQVSRDDISFIIPKNTWVQNEIYLPYRDDQEMFLPGKKFYIYNKDNRCVYKCIENTAYGPSAAGTTTGSQYIPSSTSTGIINTLDGYKWKLMYQLSAADELKFAVNGRNDLDSYIPVKYIDYTPSTEDDAGELQKSVQDSAVPGSLSSIYVNPSHFESYKYDPNICAIGTNDALFVRSDVASGGTTVTFDYFGLNTSVNSIRDMFLQVIDGPGSGQVRLIKSSQRISSGGDQYLRVSIDSLDYGLSAYVGVGSPGSKINILPSIRIYGDGSANDPTNAQYSSLASALAVPIFDSDGTLRGSDLIDIGKNYTFANITIPKGLTAISPIENSSIPSDIMLSSLSPLNGHGSNAVTELGASRVILKVSLEGDENSILNPTNDFRQVGIVKNPSLSKNTVIVRTIDGVGSGISAGATATLGGSGITAYGIVSSVYAYDDSRGREFIVTGLSGSTGNYTTINSLSIDPNDGLEYVSVAGLENKKLVNLKSTSNITTLGLGPRDIIIGVGNKSIGLSPSYASGKVLEISSADIASLQSVSGTFKENEKIYALNRTGSYVGTFTIKEISNTTPSNFKTAYNMTTKLTIRSKDNEYFTASTFNVDQLVYCFTGNSVTTPTSTTPFKANAHVFDWEANLSPSFLNYNTGVLEIVGAKPGSFAVGNYVLYYRNKIAQYALINKVVEPEILYGSGEVLYVQNFAGVERYAGSEEEINLVLGL